MNPVLEVKKLKKKFGQLTAVDGINFSISENEIFGLLGPNGSGKTTTQRMLTTVLDSSGGQIKYHGRILKPANLLDVRCQIGYVPQGECLYGDLTIRENLKFFAAPYGIRGKVIDQRIDELLAELNLTDRGNDLVKGLSGGLNKRASIAAALVHRPKILFLDEVTMGLDPNSRYHIWQLIKRLKQNTTILMTTHYMDEAESLCDRIAILSKGKVLELDRPSQILEKYQADDLNQVMARVIEEEK